MKTDRDIAIKIEKNSEARIRNLQEVVIGVNGIASRIAGISVEFNGDYGLF